MQWQKVWSSNGTVSGRNLASDGGEGQEEAGTQQDQHQHLCRMGRDVEVGSECKHCAIRTWEDKKGRAGAGVEGGECRGSVG